MMQKLTTIQDLLNSALTDSDLAIYTGLTATELQSLRQGTAATADQTSALQQAVTVLSQSLTGDPASLLPDQAASATLNIPGTWDSLAAAIQEAAKWVSQADLTKQSLASSGIAVALFGPQPFAPAGKANMTQQLTITFKNNTTDTPGKLMAHVTFNGTTFGHVLAV